MTSPPHGNRPPDALPPGFQTACVLDAGEAGGDDFFDSLLPRFDAPTPDLTLILIFGVPPPFAFLAPPFVVRLPSRELPLADAEGGGGEGDDELDRGFDNREEAAAMPLWGS